MSVLQEQVETDLPKRLREHLKLKYIGDCKCGQCQLVPLPLIDEAAREIERLRTVLADVLRVLDMHRDPEGYPHVAAVSRTAMGNAAVEAAHLALQWESYN